MKYFVSYCFEKKDGTRTEKKQYNCFSLLINNKNLFKDNKNFIYFLDEEYFKKDKPRTKVFYYLKFLHSIPEFSHIITKEFIRNFFIKKEVSFDITKINGLQIFAILSLIRHIRDEYIIVEEINNKIEKNKTYAWSNLHLLRAIIRKTINGHNHAIIYGPIPLNTEINLKENEDWTSTVPAIKTGFIPKLHKTFNPPSNIIIKTFNVRDYEKLFLTKEEVDLILEKERKKRNDMIEKVNLYHLKIKQKQRQSQQQNYARI